MRRIMPILALWATMPLFAQQAPQPQPTLTPWTMGTWQLSWESVQGRTYFIQHSDDMVHWQYFPVIEPGGGQTICYYFTPTAQGFFLRLRYTDQWTNDPDGDDFDSDGISNWDEIKDEVNGCLTDPFERDTDGDGLADLWEIENGLDPNDDGSFDPAHGAQGDPDGDGLTNLYEYWYGADPHLSDTDSDGLDDGDEVLVYYTDPGEADWDGDGLNDYAEVVTYGTDPWWWDTDEDTLSDWDEVFVHLTNPLDMDTDGDWMWDDYEIDNNFDPLDPDDGLLDADGDTLANQLEFVFRNDGYDPATHDDPADFPWAEDPDLDGLSTEDEFLIYLTNPRQPDTDGDTLNDAWELAHGFDPRINNMHTGPANKHPQADPDADGLPNWWEEVIGTNPFEPDTDSDGVDDKTENDQGSNPNDPNDNQPPPTGTVPVTVTIGDHSGSHSEIYRVILTPLEGDTQVRQRSNKSYGQVESWVIRLPKGAKYQIELKHIGTNPRYRQQPNPDYDHTLEINDTANCLAVDDPDHIMGISDESAGGVFAIKGKTATLYVPLFEWVTPKDSPVTAPNDTIGGDGRNEFTYDAASPGVLTIDLKVLVKPTGTTAVTDRHGVEFSDRCTFSLPAITGATFAWDAANAGGTSQASGEHLIAKATYTTLPALNSEFGLKQAEFQCDEDGTVLPKADFEVFFMKNETNHPELGPYPGPRPPNWYYYWKQALGYSEIEYQGTDPRYGRTPGMRLWSYETAQSKTVVFIYDMAATADSGDPACEHGQRRTTGIDVFVDTVLHEQKHVEQIALADGLVTATPGTPWQNGWSWRQAAHNHWTVGPDQCPGVAGVDDNGDSSIDNLTPTGPGELGSGDDLRLDDGTQDQWPPTLGVKPAQPWAGGYPIEDQAYNAEPDDEDAQAALDWGNPGKQHQTLYKYDD